MTGPMEVERKRRLPDDGATLTAVLTGLGWVAAEPVTEVDMYYSRPDVDYLETVECLRVRRRADFAEVTYKPPSTVETRSATGVVSKQETNVQLADGEQAASADRLLRCIGMRRLVRVDKVRTAYRHPLCPEVTVSIDELAGLGTFVETEVMGGDVTSAAATVERIEKELGVLGLPTIDLPYRDLALHAAPTPDMDDSAW
ncbi:class IV adenylate cyclase [Streptomyces harbinensis]|uniref:class IV adenylate cyclase n=1 Tax=Streptomyces harbinensis TaxID=1176198 RepID=UPI003399B1D4